MTYCLTHQSGDLPIQRTRQSLDRTTLLQLLSRCNPAGSQSLDGCNSQGKGSAVPGVHTDAPPNEASEELIAGSADTSKHTRAVGGDAACWLVSINRRDVTGAREVVVRCCARSRRVLIRGLVGHHAPTYSMQVALRVEVEFGRQGILGSGGGELHLVAPVTLRVDAGGAMTVDGRIGWSNGQGKKLACSVAASQRNTNAGVRGIAVSYTVLYGVGGSAGRVSSVDRVARAPRFTVHGADLGLHNPVLQQVVCVEESTEHWSRAIGRWMSDVVVALSCACSGAPAHVKRHTVAP